MKKVKSYTELRSNRFYYLSILVDTAGIPSEVIGKKVRVMVKHKFTLPGLSTEKSFLSAQPVNLTRENHRMVYFNFNRGTYNKNWVCYR